MTDREALLAAIRAEPADDTRRLAFADCIEESGDPDDRRRAAFIRRQIERAEKPLVYASSLPATVCVIEPCDDLPDAVGVFWLTLAPAVFGIGWTVHRGFVSGVECSWDDWCTLHKVVCADHPVTRVVLTTRPTDRHPNERPWTVNANSAGGKIVFSHQDWSGVAFELPDIEFNGGLPVHVLDEFDDEPMSEEAARALANAVQPMPFPAP